MADIDGGYVCVARKIQQSEVWKRPPECLKIWIYLLQEVNHGDRRAFPRGTNYFNYEDIARSCLLKYSTVDNWMRWLKSTGHITARKTTRGTVVTVLNYDKYQQSKSYDYGTDYGTVYETEAEHLRNTTGTINKNEKNGRTKERTEAPSAPALTPSQEAKNFFEKPEERTAYLAVMTSKGIDASVAASEMEKFVGYWTELNKTGTKQRWELERTFQVRGRISKWADNIVKRPGFGATAQSGEWTCRAGTSHTRFQGCSCPSAAAPASYADIPEITEEERARNVAALAEMRRQLADKRIIV